MADIELPQLGESVTEGTITRWFKEVGDEVAEDEPLFEVSTDKVDSEVPSPVSGYLSEILVPEGETVDVGTVLAKVSDSPGGEGDADEPAAEESADDAPEAEEAAAEEEAADAPAEDESAEAPEQDESEESAEKEAEPAAEPAAEEPSEKKDAPKAEDEKSDDKKADTSDGKELPLLSPVVRGLLADAGVSPSELTGTGIGGRITRADVENHLRDNAKAPSEKSAAAAPAAASSPVSPGQTGSRPAPPPPRVTAAAAAAVGSSSSIQLNKIRRITADHMVRSLEISAHAYVSTEVDYEAVERVRRAHKDQFKAEEGTSLTYLPFIGRALIDAIGEFPMVNGSMGENASSLELHGSVNLGIAVDLDYEGLIVPVIHDAQDQRLRALARGVSDLAGRARSRSLTADDITGGTVTITNVGSTGNAFLLPVINQPQVMILSTDGVSRKPVVVAGPDGSESIAIHSVGNLTLGWDHRAFDGAYAARFLARVREILETRDWESEL